jgi:hypothetical protein
MPLNYGKPAPPEDFIIGALIPLGIPVGPERAEETSLPCYVVTALPGKSDRFMLCPVVSVHTFATTRDEADQWAWKADNLLISLTSSDVITMPNGDTASAWVDPMQTPAFADYHDPFIKRYSARYQPNLRFLPTT